MPSQKRPREKETQPPPQGAAPEPKWVDPDDDETRRKAIFPLHNAPAWAEEAAKQSAQRVTQSHSSTDATLAKLLASTTPLVVSEQRKALEAPSVSCAIHLERENVVSLQWHRSGELLLVGCPSRVHLYHVAGRFTEKLFTVPLGKGRKMRQLSTLPNGSQAIVVCPRSFEPLLMDLATTTVTPLRFLDPREGAPYSTGARDAFVTKCSPNPVESSRHTLLMSVGHELILGSVQTACVAQRITLDDYVTDCSFVSDHEIVAAVGNRVVFYDVRRAARCVATLEDEGSIKTTRVLCSSTAIVCGSSSGVVNLYSRGATGKEKPLKSYMNLKTAVTFLEWGSLPGAQSFFVMGGCEQVGGVRVVHMPSMAVVPGFPSPGMHHSFFKCATAAPSGMPLFSLGEYGRVTTYAL